MDYSQILATLQKGQYAPVYFFDGEEPYYMDQLTAFITENALSESERDFNLNLFFGQDADVGNIISAVRQYPVMAERQVVIIKEAQALKNIEELLPIIEKPVATTVLVVNYRGKNIDKRKAFGKSVQKHSVYLNSPLIREDRVDQWIESFCSEKGYKIEKKAAQMLAEYLGNDLGKIINSINKLVILAGENGKITADLVSKSTGVSKDYNFFELQNAISARDELKAHKIIRYFSENPSKHSIVPLMYVLYGCFSKALKHRVSGAKRSLSGRRFVPDYELAAANYTPRQMVAIIEVFRDIDVRSKGVDNRSTGQEELMKELLIRIFRS